MNQTRREEELHETFAVLMSHPQTEEQATELHARFQQDLNKGIPIEQLYPRYTRLTAQLHYREISPVN